MKTQGEIEAEISKGLAASSWNTEAGVFCLRRNGKNSLLE